MNLKTMDSPTENMLLRHGAQEPFFGVKVADLKKYSKRQKRTIICLWQGSKYRP